LKDELIAAIADLDQRRVLSLVKEGLGKGEDPEGILEACQAGMDLVGKRFEQGDYFLMELVVSGKIFGKAMEIIEPKLANNRESRILGKVVIGTPKGDLHDIGKNIIATMLRGAGFEVQDLGVNVTPQRFAEVVEATHPQIVAMSALLTTTFESMKDSISAVRATDAGKRAKVIIGGAPVSDYVREFVQADAWGKDAMEGVAICKRWCAEAPA
jgi:methylmalonyl-CoA mutase cobalamin-binding domain/chain